jgi:hypothetical protein
MWLNNTQNALFSFPLQQNLRERTNMLFCAYIALLLICSIQCGSGLQDQQTEPVQITCKQLHSHTSDVWRIETVYNIPKTLLTHSAFPKV